jgi:hypothetical protein
MLAGIYRNHRFSPNHIGNDRAVFDLVAGHLREMGHCVNEYSEEEALKGQAMKGITELFVFTMAREPHVVRMLQALENDGARVINSGYGIENCYRSNMTRLFNEAGIPVPSNITVETRKPDAAYFHNLIPGWVKRGDFHAINKEDVTFVRNADEGCAILAEYALRGIETAVLNKHIVGDLVKFYGIRGTDFFFHFYPEEYQHSKFGNEAVNGKAAHYPVHIDELKSIAAHAADVLNIDIYGGDAIITPDERIYLIDMNDFPSFAPCREQAAPVIAQRINEMACITNNVYSLYNL